MKIYTNKLLSLDFVLLSSLNEEGRKNSIKRIRNINCQIAVFLLFMQVAVLVYACASVKTKLITGNDRTYGIFSAVKDFLVLIVLLHFTFTLSKILSQSCKSDSELNNAIKAASKSEAKTIRYIESIKISDGLLSLEQLSLMLKIHFGGAVILCVSFFGDLVYIAASRIKAYIPELAAISFLVLGVFFTAFQAVRVSKISAIQENAFLAPHGYISPPINTNTSPNEGENQGAPNSQPLIDVTAAQALAIDAQAGPSAPTDGLST